MMKLFMLAMAFLIPTQSHAMYHGHTSASYGGAGAGLQPQFGISAIFGSRGIGAIFGGAPWPSEAQRLPGLHRGGSVCYGESTEDFMKRWEAQRAFEQTIKIDNRYQDRKETNETGSAGAGDSPDFEFNFDLTPQIICTAQELARKKLDEGSEQLARESKSQPSLIDREITIIAAQRMYHLGEEYQEKDLEVSLMSYRMTTYLVDSLASFTPGVSVAKSLVEATTGYNYITGEDLSDFERAQAMLDVASLGGFGPMKRVFKVLEKLPGSERALKITVEYCENVGYSVIREGLTFLHKHFDSKTQQGWKEIREIISAFTPDSKVRGVVKDLPVYRYTEKAGDAAKGRWVTTDRLDLSDPKRVADSLALPPFTDLSKLKEYEFIIPAGHEVLWGVVYKNFGRPGGHSQIFIPDPSILRNL